MTNKKFCLKNLKIHDFLKLLGISEKMFTVNVLYKYIFADITS